jgi:hypothetical protein
MRRRPTGITRDSECGDRLFEGEEAFVHVMGVQIASEKRRNPWTHPPSGSRWRAVELTGVCFGGIGRLPLAG